MLDLFCGRWGWSRAFAARGWECIGIDITEPPEVPIGCDFERCDVLRLNAESIRLSYRPDFICASSPCEEFSLFGMKHFHPNPDYPRNGILLFNHTREILWDSGVPWIMENVRPAQQFVGNAVNHCGPFYMWGTGVPPIVPQGITKGIDVGSSRLVKLMTPEEKREYRAQFVWNQAWSSSQKRQRDTAKAATIPPELANATADYAERLLEVAAK